ncbi:MAG: alpha/beta hydrolase [Candidatus Omnitrophota bacterium]
MDFEDIEIESADKVALHGWFVPHRQARCVVLFFHGNAGNISHRVEKLEMLNKLGLSVFIIDYRGYGRSTGRPTETGLYRDAQAAYQYLRFARGTTPKQIIIYGESLGSAVAVELAGKVPCAGLVLEGAFSGFRDMAAIRYPYIPRALVSDSFNSLAKINSVKSPVLFIHAVSDEVVPLGQAVKLYDAYRGKKYFSRLPGQHNDCAFVSQNEYQACVNEFIVQICRDRDKN